MNPEPVAEVSLPKSIRDPHREPSATAQLVHWLARHRTFLAAFTVVYIVAIITLHDVMQQPAYWAQGKLSHRSWNNLVTAFAVPILAIFFVWMLIRLRRHDRPWVAAGYLAATVALAVLCFRTLFCMNIEAIHYPQYAILAVLLFALTGSFGQTILWGTLCGLIDEGYQYLYLYVERQHIYMDFNDVILNSVGIGFGLVLLYVSGVHVAHPRTERSPLHRRFLLSPASIATTVFAIACTAMYSAGLLRLLPAADARPWTIVLRRCGPMRGFWNATTWGKTFHEVQPLEWVVASIVLVAFYAILDSVRVAKSTP